MPHQPCQQPPQQQQSPRPPPAVSRQSCSTFDSELLRSTVNCFALAVNCVRLLLCVCLPRCRAAAQFLEHRNQTTNVRTDVRTPKRLLSLLLPDRRQPTVDNHRPTTPTQELICMHQSSFLLYCVFHSVLTVVLSTTRNGTFAWHRRWAMNERTDERMKEGVQS